VASNPTPTPTPTPDQDGEVALTLDAPAGDPPLISWREGRTLHLAGGGTAELPKAYDDVVSYRGDFLGLDYGVGNIDVVRDGQVVDTFPGNGFAVSADGTEVAWYEGDADGGQIKQGLASGMGEGEATQEVPAGFLATPLTFTPNTRLVYQLDGQREPYDRTIWFTDFDGRAIQIKGASGVGGYNPETGAVAVQTKATDFGSCWAMYSYGGGEAAESFGDETCDFSLGEFSTDGKYVIGWPAYADGWGPGEVTILDAETFEPVVRFDSGEDYGVHEAVWDSDGDSLIATVYLDGTWQLLRLGVDGSVETVSDPVEADDMSNPFRLVDVR
jgi:hypothetical protein